MPLSRRRRWRIRGRGDREGCNRCHRQMSIRSLPSSRQAARAVVMADTRTTEGTDKVFGGTMSAAVVHLKRDFHVANPNTVQALVNAFYQTLQ